MWLYFKAAFIFFQKTLKNIKTKKQKGNKKMKKLITLLLTFTLVISLTACSSETKTELEGNFNLNETAIQMSDIAGYEAITQTVIEKTQVAENEIEVTGADFSEVLSDNGFVQADLTKITLEAGDGYTVDIPTEAFSEQILLVYNVNGENLDEVASPVWVVIPNQPAKYWVKNIVNITVE